MEYTYLDLGQNTPYGLSILPFELSEKLQKWDGKSKVGDKGKVLVWCDGMLFMDTYWIKGLDKTHIGENLQLVQKTLQNLNSSFLDGWEFKVDNDFFQISIDYGKEVEQYLYIKGGDSLNIEHSDIGRLVLCEVEDTKDNVMWIEIIEVWGKRTLNGVEKDKVGKSLLTILNRITKGLDIVLRFSIGNVDRKGNHTPFDPLKLKEYYERSGFKEVESENKSQIQMSNEEIVEEYWRRIEEEKNK